MSTSRRAILGALVAAPVVTVSASATGFATPALSGRFASHDDAAWHAARAAYCAARDADEADRRTGTLRAAYDRDEACRDVLFAEYGGEKQTTGDPIGEARLSSIYQETCEAEERHYETFSRPRWQRFDEMIAIPAPSVAALLDKLSLASAEDMEDGANVIAFVIRDLKHLNGEA